MILSRKITDKTRLNVEKRYFCEFLWFAILHFKPARCESFINWSTVCSEQYKLLWESLRLFCPHRLSSSWLWRGLEGTLSQVWNFFTDNASRKGAMKSSKYLNYTIGCYLNYLLCFCCYERVTDMQLVANIPVPGNISFKTTPNICRKHCLIQMSNCI